MSSFHPKTFTSAEFESLGHLLWISTNFTAIRHPAVPAIASTSGVRQCSVHAQQIWDTSVASGLLHMRRSSVNTCAQESVNKCFLRAYCCREKSLTKMWDPNAWGFCILFPARSPYKWDSGRDVALSLWSYPELCRWLPAYVLITRTLGCHLASKCKKKKKKKATTKEPKQTSYNAEMFGLLVDIFFVSCSLAFGT